MHQRFITRRGQQAVRPIALVEHTLEEHRLAIEMEARDTLQIRLNLNRAERAIRAHNILLFLRFRGFLLNFLRFLLQLFLLSLRFRRTKFQRRRHVIQIRIVRRPQVFGPRCDFRAHLAHASRQQFVRDDRAVRGIGYDDMQFGIRLVSADFRANKQSAVGGALQRKRLHVRFRHDLHPHALPNGRFARCTKSPRARFSACRAFACPNRSDRTRTTQSRKHHRDRRMPKYRRQTANIPRHASHANCPLIKRRTRNRPLRNAASSVRIADLPNRLPSPKRHGMHHRAIQIILSG